MTNISKESSIKHDTNKPRYSLVPQNAMIEIIKGFEYGARKYEAYNHTAGMEYTRYTDALYRHLNAWLLREDIDKESDVHHLALVACNAMMALENILMGKGKDTRNPYYIQKKLVSLQKKNKQKSKSKKKKTW